MRQCRKRVAAPPDVADSRALTSALPEPQGEGGTPVSGRLLGQGLQRATLDTLHADIEGYAARPRTTPLSCQSTHQLPETRTQAAALH
jgi:hypothetical protein